MSGYQHREGSGTIKVNKFKDNDRKPDYRGDALFEGKMIEIALWRRAWPDGTEYFSAQIQPARERQAAAPQPAVGLSGDGARYATETPGPAYTKGADDDAIPF